MRQIDFPLTVSTSGRTALTDPDEHLRDLIEQVLFTSPGERINRPDFGSGLLQLLFGPASDEAATAAQFLVQGALQQWLGDRLTVRSVEVEARDSAIVVTVQYLPRGTDLPQTALFRRER